VRVRPGGSGDLRHATARLLRAEADARSCFPEF
jgi:hypothetical protein